MSQSSNDVIPTAIHVSADAWRWRNWLPAMKHLAAVLKKKAPESGPRSKPGAPT